ncbi:MAG: glycosyltransferase family 2 protein, partial [Bacteroidales bacterium]|nr:glycosyltransferase family 2 protein [Bacteroidales bacterium]
MSIQASLIISTYNRPQSLHHVLESVKNQSLLPHEVIIADDGSGYETDSLIQQFQKNFPVPLIHSWQKDLGFRQASSKNKAAAKSSGNYLLFLDGDLVLHPHYIKNNICSARERCFVVNTRVLLKEKTTNIILKSGIFKLNIWQLLNQKNRKNGFYAPFLNKFIPDKQSIKPSRGGLMGIWKNDYLAVNGMNEDFIGWGHEDTDLFIRLLKYGLKRIDNKFMALSYHLYHPKENTNRAEANKLL